jgi:hypothetical protein
MSANSATVREASSDSADGAVGEESAFPSPHPMARTAAKEGTRSHEWRRTEYIAVLRGGEAAGDEAIPVPTVPITSKLFTG